MSVENRSQRLEELRKIVEDAAKGSELLELLKLLIERPESRPEARERAFRALSADPKNPLVRLMLAKSFYLDGLGEFCVRELVELTKYANAPTLDKLIYSFGSFVRPFLQGGASGMSASEGGTDESREESVLAEIDLESDFADAFDDLDNKS